MCGRLVDNHTKKRYTQKEIGTMFGINSRTVSSVINGKHWKHVNRDSITGGL